MEQEIREIIERNMDLMLTQTKVYTPFLRIAFPAVSNLTELCYNLMVGNALSTLLSQYALRMKIPDEKDFAEFNTIVGQYREKVKGMF